MSTRFLLSLGLVSLSLAGVPSSSATALGDELASNSLRAASAVLATLDFSRSLPDRGRSAQATTLSDAEIQTLGQQAYLWGWPMVYVRNCRNALGKLNGPGVSGGMPVAPPNQLCMLTDYISPKASVVPCPNQDVIYGFGVLDLADEPAVLQVPDFGERFWLFQLGDQRTDSFAEMGRMYGTKPGHYLIVGPRWNGTPPPGIVAVLRSPTNIGYVLPRVFKDDTEADRLAAQAVLPEIVMYPLRRYDGEIKRCDWSRARWLPRIGSSDRSRSRWVVAETFFDVFPEILEQVEPLPGEEPLYAEFRRLMKLAAEQPQVKRRLVQIAVATENDVLSQLFEFRNLGTSAAHHWTTVTNGAAFGTDYLTRTAIARSNVFVNRQQETKYFYQDFDARGVRLHGEHEYRVTFPPGELPPTRGFWSLTLYDENHNFHPNALERHSLGTKSRSLRKNDDGSLTIFVQRDSPGRDLESNWLPAPDGHFSLYLRVYWPAPALLDGSWTPPPVVKGQVSNEPAE